MELKKFESIYEFAISDEKEGIYGVRTCVKRRCSPNIDAILRYETSVNKGITNRGDATLCAIVDVVSKDYVSFEMSAVKNKDTPAVPNSHVRRSLEMIPVITKYLFLSMRDELHRRYTGANSIAKDPEFTKAITDHGLYLDYRFLLKPYKKPVASELDDDALVERLMNESSLFVNTIVLKLSDVIQYMANPKILKKNASQKKEVMDFLDRTYWSFMQSKKVLMSLQDDFIPKGIRDLEKVINPKARAISIHYAKLDGTTAIGKFGGAWLIKYLGLPGIRLMPDPQDYQYDHDKGAYSPSLKSAGGNHNNSVSEITIVSSTESPARFGNTFIPWKRVIKIVQGQKTIYKRE